MDARSTVELTAGTLDYADTGGDGEPVVLVHGLTMDESVWAAVVEDLRADHRVLVPVMPSGGHRRPMHPDADLSPVGQARILAEFLDRLDLRGATVVQNDIGTAQLMVGVCDERVGRLVLTSCEALDNYPPGIQGRTLSLVHALPGGMALLRLLFRPRLPRRLPFSLGGMAKRRLPDALTDRWLRPLLTDPGIRRDLDKLLSGSRKGQYLAAGEKLRGFDRPALVAWGAEDRMMPLATGRRLAELLPQGRFTAVPDARTLVPFDNPAALAAELREFIRTTKAGA